MASYIHKASISGMAFTLLIFALTLQHYVLFSAFWYKTGVFDVSNSVGSFNQDPFFNSVFTSNWGIDRFTSLTNRRTTIVDAIACALSVFIAFLPVVGRVGIADVFWLSLWGSFFYEVSNGLLWRWAIEDLGFLMRVFVYGSFLGLLSSLILGKRDTT